MRVRRIHSATLIFFRTIISPMLDAPDNLAYSNFWMDKDESVRHTCNYTLHEMFACWQLHKISLHNRATMYVMTFTSRLCKERELAVSQLLWCLELFSST